MNSFERSPTMRLKIVLARLERKVGWVGLLGLALAVTAALAVTWEQSHMPAADHSERVATDVVDHARIALSILPVPTAVEVPALPLVADIPLLLAQIQKLALDQGLGWPRADYRVHAATDDMPVSMDVRCALKGPYPNVRSFVAGMLHEMPTLTLREFSLRRPNSDVSEVEAKLSLVIYLVAQPTERTKQASDAETSAGTQ